MITSRRQFLKGVGLGMGSLSLYGFPEPREVVASISKNVVKAGDKSAFEIARDESFWFPVQQAFRTDRSLINLNNGGVHPAPSIVIDAVKRYMDFSNGAPAHNSWRILRPRKELIRKKIAGTFGCSPEEIALVRNVTEAMQIALLGINLNPGDEILTTSHDYPSMKNAVLQREKLEGVKVNMFDFPYPPKDLNVLTELFKKNITSKTKLILFCHITNLTGQIFPVKDICRLAREKNIDVVIDGAHAFGHFVFKRNDLECDIYGANLHKWMMAPIGTGFLYIKKEKIKEIRPLFPAPDPFSEDIRKFEHIGTHQEYLKLAIGDALDFHHGIGAARKEARLRYLRDYWAKEIMKLPGVKILTSFEPEQSCGIGTFSVEGMDMGKLSGQLLNQHKIYTTTVGLPDGVHGMRVTPSIYTTLNEIDVFIEAVSLYARNGLPE
jgi:selenocysteine lyase/cysteine desulfurase